MEKSGIFTKKGSFYGLESVFPEKMKIFENLVVGREGSARERGGRGPENGGVWGTRAKRNWRNGSNLTPVALIFCPKFWLGKRRLFDEKWKNRKNRFFFLRKKKKIGKTRKK